MMARENEIDIQAVMNVIRRRAETRREKGEQGASLCTTALSSMQRATNILRINSLAALESKIGSVRFSARQVGLVNPRPRGLHNELIQIVKRAIQRSLTWYTRSLVYFHKAVIETLETIRHGITELHQTDLELHDVYVVEIQRLREQLTNEREHDLRQLHDRIAQIAHSIDGPGSLSEKLRRNERDIRRISNLVQPAIADGLLNAAARQKPLRPSGLEEFDYFLFEERFRGSEATIMERQKSYLSLFEGREDVVDLGCGRGEFLEILRENGIVARGAESNRDMFLLCREKSLDVVQQDLFAFLEATPDATLGGVFCSQVIEHLTAADQLRLVTLVRQKTKPGSPVVLETINPECVYALVRNFFLDPTHIRPVHPEMLKFACEAAGFSEVSLRFAEPLRSAHIPKLTLQSGTPSLDSFNTAIEHLNNFLFGYQDYAVVARC